MAKDGEPEGTVLKLLWQKIIDIHLYNANEDVYVHSNNTESLIIFPTCEEIPKAKQINVLLL